MRHENMNFVNASNLPRHVKPIMEEYGLRVETKAEYDDVYSAETGLHETILLGKKGSAEPFNIYVKRGLRAQTAVLYFGTVLRHAEKENVKPLCISDRIVGSVADLARRMKVPYADLSGNAWIPGENFLVFVEGKAKKKLGRQ